MEIILSRTFILVDALNMYFRAKHVAVRGDIDQRIGLALHITLMSILSASQRFNADHVVLCLEGRSWRKDFYEPYKKNRAVARGKLKPKEIEDDEMFFEAYNDLCTFISEHTNVTVLQHDRVEADDFIARWIQNHPKDEHIIVSSDSDFVQLLSDNVRQYNGIANQIVTIDGFYDEQNNPIIDKKTKAHKQIAHEVDKYDQPAFALFEKCMRGDTSDNIFSAFPGVRKKGSQKKAGLLEAFADRGTRGFTWNNLMLQRWVDHNNVEHRVRDDYERNVILVDLTEQPDEIKEMLDETITVAQRITRNNKQIGVWFMKFCGKHNLPKVSDNAQAFGKLLTAGYINNDQD